MRKQRQPSSCLFSRRSASVGWAGPPDKQQRLAFLPEDSENKEGNYFAGMFSGMSARGSINNSINNGRNAGSVNGDNGDSFESPSCEGSSGGGGGGGNGGDGGDGDGIGGSNRDGMVKEEEDIPTEVPGRTPKGEELKRVFLVELCSISCSIYDKVRSDIVKFKQTDRLLYFLL